MADTAAFEALAQEPLCIAPRYLGYMLGVLEGRFQARAPRTPMLLGRALSGTAVVDGIALVPLTGPIMRRTDAFEEMFGAVSVDAIRSSLWMAMADPNVRGVLLAIDSPGGSVAGIADLADEIRALRGRKPMRAVADEGMFSAAYWLGSATDRVLLPRTGSVGSIGALVAHIDASGFLAQQGLKVTVVKSGEKKAQFSPFQPLSDEARADLQAEVDRIAGLFFQAVATQRGLDVETLRDFAGGTFEGAAAVRAGLADQVTTLEGAFRALQQDITGGAGRERRTAMADEGTPAAGTGEGTASNVIDFEAKAAELRTKARAEGLADERTRTAEITAWCNFAKRPDLAAQFITDGLTIEDVRARLLTATASTGPEVQGERPLGEPKRYLTAAEIFERRRQVEAAARGGR